MTTTFRADAVAASPMEAAPPVPPPLPDDAPMRQMPLMVSEEEAEALMHVLLLAPMEGGAFGAAMERVLSRVADLQRAFARDEIP